MDRTISPDDLKKLRNSSSVALLDVRRKNDIDASSEKILGANWCDPDLLDEWAGQNTQEPGSGALLRARWFG